MKKVRKSISQGFVEEDLEVNEKKRKMEKGDNENQVDTESGNEPAQECLRTDEMETEENTMENTKGALIKQKKRKKGIIYISNIPKHMNVMRLREILGQFGKIGRVYLQPEKISENDKSKKRKRVARTYTEGWVEFQSKKVAKKVVEFLNNQQISSRKRSQFYDCLWSMKYLPRFKWVHLTERLNYEQAVYKQRLMTEVSQARKEATFFQNNLDKSEMLKKKNKKAMKNS